jgi:acyl-[acyl-carrier-protein] desaturase
VPWDRCSELPTGRWEVDDTIGDAARSALFVNLLTEDNLPYYFRSISGRFGNEDVWGTWVRRWTAEEGRHAIVLRDYLTVTRTVDPIALERARMTQVSDGVVPEPATVADALAYVTLQELATRIAHDNTGRLLRDGAGRKIMRRVAADENLHHLFYRDLTSAALEIDPETMVPAIERQGRHFAMPGTGIPDFSRHARTIAQAGVYDFQVHHDQILVPVLLRQWNLDRLHGLKATAERARERLLDHVDRVGRVARRLVERRIPEVAT